MNETRLHSLEIMMNNFLTALFGTLRKTDYEQKQQEEAVPVIEKEISPSVLTNRSKGKFDVDVKALKTKCGSFTSGLCIEITLQELLSICPRNRARVDAYRGLVSYLQKCHGVKLIIKSRKTK